MFCCGLFVVIVVLIMFVDGMNLKILFEVIMIVFVFLFKCTCLIFGVATTSMRSATALFME